MESILSLKIIMSSEDLQGFCPDPRVGVDPG
jgi:hypothetical protein